MAYIKFIKNVNTAIILAKYFFLSILTSFGLVYTNSMLWAWEEFISFLEAQRKKQNTDLPLSFS